MLLLRSPSILFALFFSIISLILIIITFKFGYNHPDHNIQFLIILPPLNIIFLFLLSLIWIERRFRLSYVPFISLILLLISAITITMVSSLFLSTSSIIIYMNFIFYLTMSLLLCFILLLTIISYIYSALNRYRYNRSLSIQQKNKQLQIEGEAFQIDKLVLKAKENEFWLFMSKSLNNPMDYDINNIIHSLNEINVDIVLTLNETTKLSSADITDNYQSNIDVCSASIKRSNIEHIVYSAQDHCIPKSISAFIQFLYNTILVFNRSNLNHLYVHGMGGMEINSLTIVCFKLLYDHMMDENEQQKEQKFIERICHYPLLLVNYCRVCQAISNVRKTRPGSVYNPLQILYVHEFYARLKSLSYMQHIKNINDLNEKYLLSRCED